MKIGEFAKANNLSKETVRFYTEIGLLSPVKYRNFYSYGESCQMEIDDINELKELGYTLQEINQFLTNKRFSYKGSEKFEKYSEESYKNKLTESIDLFNTLEDRIKKLNEKLTQLKNHPSIDEKTEFGFPLGYLSLLVCPRCGKRLILMNGQIADQKIINGEFGCECDYSVKVEKGILICETAFLEPFAVAKPELDTKPISDEYANCAAASTNWIMEKMRNEDTANKTILDIRTMGGIFSKKLMDTLKKKGEDFLYIGVDPDFENIDAFRKKLETDHYNTPVILCCGEYHDLPFRENIADYIVNFIGLQALGIYYEKLPFEEGMNLLKEGGKWFGCMYWVEQMKYISEKYKRISRHLLKESLMERVKLFEDIRFHSTGKTTDPGEIAFYFNENPEVFFSVFKIEQNNA